MSRSWSAPSLLPLSPAVFFHIHSLIMTLNLAPTAPLTFFLAWKLFKLSEEHFFPLFQCEALKFLIIPVLGGSLHSSLIWLGSLHNRACIEHSFLTLSERSFTTHFSCCLGHLVQAAAILKKGLSVSVFENPSFSWIQALGLM